jgi:tetratricopeptide (TPR) repeat protein
MLATLHLALVLALAPGGLLKNPEADRLLGEAQAAFEAEDFAKASKLLEEAYLIEPNAQLLYPWAQAERSLGNCETAITLYERFLESKPAKQFADAAQGNIDRCREQVESDEGAMILDDETATDEESGEDLLGGTEAEPEPEPEPEPVTAPQKRDAPKKPKAWFRDPVGGVLVGLGLGGVGAGAALMGLASSRAKSIGNVELNTEYEDTKAGAAKLNTGGLVAVSIGGALLVSGIVRWAVVARKNKASQSAALWLQPGQRGMVGVAWSGRF